MKSNMLSRLRQEREKLEHLLATASESKPERLRSLRLELKNINKQMDQWSLW